MSFTCPEGCGILSAFKFCMLKHFWTTPVSIVTGLRSTKKCFILLACLRKGSLSVGLGGVKRSGVLMAWKEGLYTGGGVKCKC